MKFFIKLGNAPGTERSQPPIGAEKGIGSFIYRFFSSFYPPFLLSVTVLLFLHWNRLSMLPWSDEINTLRLLSPEVDFYSFLPQNFPYRKMNGHPPGYQMAVWLLQLLTNDWVAAARLASLLSTTILLFALGKIARLIAPPVSVWIFFTFFCTTPLYIWLSTYMTADIAYAAFGFYGLYALASRQSKAMASVALSLSMFMRESALAFVAAAFLFEFARSKRLKPSSYCFLLAPIFVLLSHIAIVYWRYGSWSTHPYSRKMLEHTQAEFFHLNAGKLESFWRAVELMLTQLHYSVFLAFLFFLASFFLQRTKRMIPLISALLAAGIGVFGFFVFYEDFIERDFFPAFLVIILFSSALIGMGIQKLGRHHAWASIASLACVVYWLAWHESRDFDIYFRDHSRVTHLAKAASQFLESNHPGSIVFAAWPVKEALRTPLAGYVNKPLEIAETAEDADLLVTTDDQTAKFFPALPSLGYQELIFSLSSEDRFFHIYKLKK